MDTTKQYCSSCQNNRTIDKFTEGFKSCDRCREKKLKRYHRLRDHYLDLKKEYQQNHKEEIAEKQKAYFQSKKHIVITCPVCNYDIKQYKKSQHEKSMTHQNNLKQSEQKPKTFINQDLLENQYQLTEQFLCCDE